MPSSRAGGALGGPCWPSSAQQPNKEISEHFAHGPIRPLTLQGWLAKFSWPARQVSGRGARRAGQGSQV
eukprot:1151275-Pelagomonas_calceolata.AAC.6